MAKFINELNRFKPLPSAVVESDMSNEACRLYWLMAIKPDDWEYYQKPLMKQMGISSPRTFRKYMKELIDNGWLSSEGQKRNADGSWSACTYILHSMPDVQKMHHGEQNLPCGKICRTVKSDQHNNNTLTLQNKHPITSHTHTADGSAFSEKDKTRINTLDSWMYDNCPELELRFQPMTDTQKVMLFNTKQMSLRDVTKMLMDINAKRYDYIVGASLFRLVEKFWERDFERRKKK